MNNHFWIAMNNKLGFLPLCIVCACIAVPVTATAGDEEGRFYIKGDLGGNYTPDADLKEFFGPVEPGSKVKFDPGFRFGIHGGYNVTDWFAPELEVGVMGNWIKSITGATRVHDAVFMNVPSMANLKFQLPNQSRVIPYIGGGAGVSMSILDADEITISYQGRTTSLTGSDATAVFAYQGFAGVRFKLNESMTLDLEYRYFATQEPEWTAEEVFYPPPPSDRTSFGRIQTHAVSLTFDYRF